MSGNFAIGHGDAGRNHADDRVDPLVEVGLSAVVDRNIRQIALFATEQRNDAVNCMSHMGRRRRFARSGVAPAYTRARRSGVRLRQLHADDTARTPDDAAGSDRSFEECETLFHCDGEYNIRRQPAPPDSWSAFIAMRSGFGMGLARPPDINAT